MPLSSSVESTMWLSAEFDELVAIKSNNEQNKLCYPTHKYETHIYKQFVTE